MPTRSFDFEENLIIVDNEQYKKFWNDLISEKFETNDRFDIAKLRSKLDHVIHLDMSQFLEYNASKIELEFSQQQHDLVINIDGDLIEWFFLYIYDLFFYITLGEFDRCVWTTEIEFSGLSAQLVVTLPHSDVQKIRSACRVIDDDRVSFLGTDFGQLFEFSY